MKHRIRLTWDPYHKMWQISGVHPSGDKCAGHAATIPWAWDAYLAAYRETSAFHPSIKTEPAV